MNHPLWQLAGWTIVHFAWLGIAALLVLAVLRWLTGRLPASIRYALSLISLLTIAALPVAIASYLTATLPNPVPAVASVDVSVDEQPLTAVPQSAAPPSVSELPTEFVAASTPIFAPAEASPSLPGASLTNSPVAVEPPSDLAQITAIVEASARWLPWLWVVGSPVMLVWLLGGLSATRRLRTTARAIDDSALAALAARLRQRLRVSQRVAVMVSERVRTPVLVGIIKPLVLLPPAALTGWSSEELEFALLHELAHVRRCDNLVNLLQRAIEALLWFHPAVWITSHWVRVDREHCCDALVVRHTGRPHDYARLLVDVASGTRCESSPALASAMARHPLASRVRRILNLPEEPMRVSRSGLAAVMLGLLGVANAWLWWPEGTRADNPVPSSAAADSAVPAAEIPSANTFLDASHPIAHPPVTATLQVDDSAPTTGTPLTDSPLDPSRPFSQLPFTGSIPQAEPQHMFERVVATFDDDAPFEQVAAVVKEHARPNVSVSIQRQSDGRTLIIAKETVIGAISPQPMTTAPAPSADPNSFQFPTLEEQQQRDTAYALLYCEVEPLTEEQLAVCREHKFTGGVRVALAQRVQPASVFADGDIIVGLHVWPTRSIAELAQVLVRPDMPGGTPIKFYALRPIGSGSFGGGGRGGFGGEMGGGEGEGGTSDEAGYELVSYRLTLDADQQRELRMSQMRQATADPTLYLPAATTVKPGPPTTLPPAELKTLPATTTNLTPLTAPADPSAASAPQPAPAPSNDRDNPRLRLELYTHLDSEPAQKALENLAKLRNAFPQIAIRVLDAKDEASWHHAKLRNISRVPTYVLYANGAEISRSGAVDEGAIRSLIENLSMLAPPAPSIAPTDPATASNITPLVAPAAPAAVSPLPWSQPPPVKATGPANADRWNNAPPVLQPTELPSSPAMPLDDPATGTGLNTFVPAEPGQPQTTLWVFRDEGHLPAQLREALSHVQTKHRRLNVIQIDVNQQKSMAAAFGIHTTPTLLLCEGSDVKGRLEGVATAQQVEELIEPPLPDGLAVYQIWRDEKELEFNKPALEALRERYHILNITYFPIGDQANPQNQVIADKLGVSETPVVVVANGDKVLAKFTDEVTVEQLDAALPAEKENLRTPPQPLRYAGKTFEAWKNTWRNELAPEQTVQAVEAFAAFARAGRAEDAANEILDVAVRYNWEPSPNALAVENPVRGAVIDAFANGSSPAVPRVVWLKELARRLQKDYDKYRFMAGMLISAPSGTPPGTRFPADEAMIIETINAMFRANQQEPETADDFELRTK